MKFKNGLEDFGEPGMINKSVMLFPDNVLMTTNSGGVYWTAADSGSYVVSLLPDPIWNLSTGTSSFNIQVDTLPVCCNNFGLPPVSAFDNVALSYTSGQLRCGFDIPATITLSNTGTTIISGVIRYLPDNLITLVSAFPLPSSTSGDTLFFNYTNLAPGQTFNIGLIYEMHMTPGILICSNTLASIFDGTSNQPFTENLFCDTITCSFDPNDKQVIPPGVKAAHDILKTDSLLYTIRFQNEGTDTAFTVVLRDQLSNLLDRNTIELVSSSHPVTLSINSSNLAEFRFDNILLPHKAVNEPGSNGFVKFRILPIQGLTNGTVINNSVGIYFDFNASVITDTAFVTLVTTIPVGISEVEKTNTTVITPNPFTDQCEIIITSAINNFAFYQVIDIAGRKIFDGTTAAGLRMRIQLRTSGWDNGIYFIRILSSNGDLTAVSKLVKQ